jgi:hypothetical protein
VTALRALDALLELLDRQAAVEVVPAEQVHDGGAVAVAGTHEFGPHAR